MKENNDTATSLQIAKPVSTHATHVDAKSLIGTANDTLNELSGSSPIVDANKSVLDKLRNRQQQVLDLLR